MYAYLYTTDIVRVEANLLLIDTCENKYTRKQTINIIYRYAKTH